METDKLNDRDIKTNGETQLTIIETKDIIHCTRSPTSEENKKSG